MELLSAALSCRQKFHRVYRALTSKEAGRCVRIINSEKFMGEKKNMQYNKCLHIKFHLLNTYNPSFLFVGHKMLQI